MKVWRVFIAYVLFICVAEVIIVGISKLRRKKRPTKLQKECVVWNIFLGEYKSQSNKINDELYKNVKTALGNQDIDNLKHGRCVLEADLGVLGVVAIIYSFIQVLLISISKVAIYLLLIGVLPIDNPKYDTTTEIMSKIIEVILVALWVWVIYPLISTYKKERYFLELLNNVIDEQCERISNAENENATMEKKVEQLQSDVHVIKNKMCDSKANKTFEIRFAIGKK